MKSNNRKNEYLFNRAHGYCSLECVNFSIFDYIFYKILVHGDENVPRRHTIFADRGDII